MRRRVVPLVLVLVLAASACGGDDGDGAADGSTATETASATDEELPHEADPLSVTITADESAASSAVVSPRGGSVSATGADGTAYRLDVPAGAVVDDVEITLTPVTSIEPAPLSGGLAGAVTLGPDGLELGVPATLTIEPSSPPEPSTVLAIGWTGDGDDVGLEPVSGSADALLIPVDHFSGYGAGTGTADDVDSLVDQAATRCRSQYQSELAHMTGGIGMLQGLGNDDAKLPLDDFADMLVQWFDRCVQPRLEAGKSDDETLVLGIRELLVWWQSALGFGLDEDGGVAGRRDTGVSLAVDGLRNALERAHEECVAHELAVVWRMFRWGQLGQAVLDMGGSVAAPDVEPAQVMKDEILPCLSFELSWVSDMSWTGGGKTSRETFDGTAVLLPEELGDGTDLTLVGDGPGTVTLDSVLSACTVASQPGPVALTPQVTGLSIEENTVVDALIGVMLTTPATWQCPEGIDMDWWPQTFLFVGGWLHPELREGEALRLDGWTPGSGVETYATHTLSASTQDQGGTPMQEQATFTLRHAAYSPRTPAPAPLASAFDPPEQI